MALRRCRECRKKISTTAAACPHCGAVAPTNKNGPAFLQSCPKCGSTNTRKYGKASLGLYNFMIGGCLILIPVIGWVLAPFFLLAAILAWVTAPFPTAKVHFQCLACKKWFTVLKKELTNGQ